MSRDLYDHAGDGAGWHVPRAVVLGLLASVVSTIIALSAGILDRSRPLTFGHDFLPPYVAGAFVNRGRAAALYDGPTFEHAAAGVMADANLTGDASAIRWINPSFFAPLFAPFALLPYRPALLAWTALNAGLLAASLTFLAGHLPAGRPRRAFALLVLTSCPLLLAMQHGQNTFLSLALACAATAAWRARRPLLAGLLVGLLAYKPQIAALLAVALWAHQGRRALAGLLIAGVGLLLVGEWVAPGSTAAFVRDVPSAVRAMQDRGFNWGRQVTPTGFLRGLAAVPSNVATGVGLTCTIVVTSATAWVVHHWRTVGRPSGDAIALAFVALPLAAPYFMDYDLLLLAVPAALTASWGRRFAIAWVGLWAAAYVNADLVRATGVPAVVPAALALAAFVVRRGSVRSGSVVPMPGAVPPGPDRSLTLAA